MRNFRSILALLVTSLSLVACGGSSNDSHAPQLRAVHLSPDAPAVDVSVNGDVVLEDVTYRQASQFLALDEGNNNVKVLVANTDTAVIDATLDLQNDMKYTVIAANTVANIEPIVITDMIGAPTDGFAAITVVHGAPSAPPVDVYVSAPGDDFAGLSPLLTGVPFKTNSSELEVPAGDYRVRVTPATSSDVIYDSGTISLTSGVEYYAIAADNNDGGASPIGLTVLTDSSATPFLNVNDVRTRFRAVHASADAPNVDVLVNDGLLPSLTDVPFGMGSAYLAVQPATYNVKVVPTGTTTAVIEADLALESGVDYTVAAINPVATIEPLVLVDDNTPPAAGNIKLRLVHASPSAGPVDIYITAPGTDISAIEPNLSNVPFKANSGYLEVPAGNYQVRIAVAGTKTVAIDTGALALTDGQIRTAFATDGKDGVGFGVILLADRN